MLAMFISRPGASANHQQAVTKAWLSRKFWLTASNPYRVGGAFVDIF